MRITRILLVTMCLGMTAVGARGGDLEADFRSPPDSAKAWCYWWWLNGAASKKGITRDFEEMKRQGIAGALLFDAGEAGAEAPRGPHFMSPQWRELFKHAVREADRLGITLGVNLASGWNAGGPWITAEHAAKKIVASQITLKGPGHLAVSLPRPETVEGFYRDITVLASQEQGDGTPKQTAIWQRDRTVDLTTSTDAKGHLTWEAPPGTWTVLRIGYTLHNNKVKCVGSGPVGPELDVMSAAAMDVHFAATGALLAADAGPLAGKSLQYYHIDSWELGQPTWTPDMRAEFQRRRGYDPLFYLPALVKKTVDSGSTTQRFLYDYRRTAADLVAANYYGRLRELTLKAGLRGTHPESGGPFFEHWIDALQCEGINDIPMGEFWKRNSEPDGQIGWQGNPSLKQVACAAHIFGKPVCQAEAFTSFACDWIDDPWTMKDIGDDAFCHGLTRNVLCFYVHQPRLDIKPGFQWAHVGTHFDRNITWWDMSGAWLAYLARCQLLLRQGHFVADFAYLQPEEIPGFLPMQDKQEPARPAGFDYDVLNTEVLLSRTAAKEGRLVLPDGMSYRYLVLPNRSPLVMSPRALRKIQELVEGGVTVLGPRPERTGGLTDYPRCDQELASLAGTLWPAQRPASGERKSGNGRVIWGRSLAEIVRADGLPPDLEFRSPSPQSRLEWIHRRDGQTDIYFLSNQSSGVLAGELALRTTAGQPELWDAVTAEIRDLPEWQQKDGRTTLPLVLAPRGSLFVIFRKPAESARTTATKNFPKLEPLTKIDGPWHVSFDPKWGGPERIAMDRLQDWTSRPEEGVRHYSGTAIYRAQFRLAKRDPASQLFLDLGTVKNVARVKLNGQEVGVVWTAPWHVDISQAVRPGTNELEIAVANLWPNRLIGDATLPPEKRFTHTNVRTYDTMASGTYGCKICEARKKSGQPAQLLPSGLLGPVTIQAQP